MKLNRKKFAMFFCLFMGVVWMVGCTAAWLGAVSALLPAAEAAVSAIIAFVMALEGKTVPPSVSAKIQQIGQDIAGEVANVQQLITAFQAQANSTLLAQIQAVLQAIVQNLGSILTDAQITDTATVSKLTQFVGLAVAAFQAVLALVPLAIAKLDGGSVADLKAEDKVVSKSLNDAHKAVKETYVAILSEKTDNVDVNSALDSLPKSLP